LVRDEIALNKKLNGLDTLEFLCLSCLAEELGVTQRDLRHKIEDFKESGCTLFGE
jgi:biotin operon repressor